MPAATVPVSMDLADVDAARSMLMECAACAKLTEMCWTTRVDWGQQEVAALAGNGSLRCIILYIGSFIVGLSTLDNDGTCQT